MSKLYFRFSPMNSGKSTALIQVAHNYERNNKKVLVIKPWTDTKSPHVLSRIGVSRDIEIEATPELNLFDEVGKHQDVFCVLVDEAQFCTPEHIEQLFHVAVRLNIPVIAYGLRTDFQTRMFPGSRRLMELAHSIEELKTVCTECVSKKALFNARKVDGVYVQEGAQVAIDGEVEYEPLCGKCYLAHVGDVAIN